MIWESAILPVRIPSGSTHSEREAVYLTERNIEKLAEPDNYFLEVATHNVLTEAQVASIMAVLLLLHPSQCSVPIMVLLCQRIVRCVYDA